MTLSEVAALYVSVDSERCTGHGRCAASCPEVFTLDDLGYCDIEEDKPVPEALAASALEGVSACPERALRWHEAGASVPG
jgi:ferredoxin